VPFRRGRCRHTKVEGCTNAGVPGAGRRVPDRGAQECAGALYRGSLWGLAHVSLATT
jgi:hypothetical protein